MKSENDVHKQLKAFQLKAGLALDQDVHARIDKAPRSPGSAPDRLTVGIWAGKIGKLAIAASVVLVMALVWGQRNVAWAEVVEHFQSADYVKVSMFIKGAAYEAPQQIQIWTGKKGNIRMMTGSQVILAKHGHIVGAYDLLKQSETEPVDMAVDVLAEIGPAEEFSLNTIIQSISQGVLEDITPSLLVDAHIVQDLVVFEGRSSLNQGMVRIYALRQSKLPVSFRIWDPVDGSSVEALFTYPKSLSDAFFDPYSIAETL
jgi:hypothetical protein